MSTIILFFTSLTYAQMHSIDRRGDSIYLSADSCDEVNEQIKVLAAWSKWSQNKDCAVSEKDDWGMGDFGECEANITKCLPNHVKKYHGVHPDIAGPNCWNLSMVMADILPNLRYSTPEEMTFFMGPPLCRKLKNQEKRRPGDVGTIRRGGGAEVHGFIYISEELSYSKNGYSNWNPYALQPLKKVYDVYGIKDQGQECLSNRLGPKCSSGTEFYRCISMKEYLDDESKKVVQLNQVHPLLEHVECLASVAAFERTSYSSELISTISSTVKALNRYLNDELEKTSQGSFGEKDTFIIASTKLRLEAISKQLYNVTDTNWSGQSLHEDTSALVNLLSNSQKKVKWRSK